VTDTRLESPGQTTGDSAMTERLSGDPDAGDRFVRLDEGEMHVVVDGQPGAPALVLIHGTGASAAWWDPVVPGLADAHRVIRVDLLSHWRPTSPARYDFAVQARRVAAAADKLGVSRVTAIGHSSGGGVTTALAEQRPDLVAALALINTGPRPDAFIPQGPASGLLEAPLLGPLLWRLLKGEGIVRKAMSSAFTRPVEIPEALVQDTLGMAHRALAGTGPAFLNYLRQRSVPDRLAALDRPVLVIFGEDDRRWHSSSAADYRAVPGARVELLPGVGHTPMMEEPQATGTLLLDFAATTGHPG
jgi:pimeloyl-ACP methyl ester carboxylesterase